MSFVVCGVLFCLTVDGAFVLFVCSSLCGVCCGLRVGYLLIGVCRWLVIVVFIRCSFCVLYLELCVVCGLVCLVWCVLCVVCGVV